MAKLVDNAYSIWLVKLIMLTVPGWYSFACGGGRHSAVWASVISAVAACRNIQYTRGIVKYTLGIETIDTDEVSIQLRYETIDTGEV